MCFVGPCVLENCNAYPDRSNGHYSINPQQLPLNDNAHRQVAAKVLRWKASAHPSTTKKNSQCHRGKVKCMFVTGCKVHFCDQKCPLPSFTLSKRRFGKLFFVQSEPLLCVLWAPKPLKQQGKPTKTRQKCVKITQKWLLGAF